MRQNSAKQRLTAFFEELGLNEVFEVVLPNHSVSIRVLERIGMQRVDLLDDVPWQPLSLVFKARRSG